MRTNASGVTEVASLRGNDKLYQANYDAIDWGNKKSELLAVYQPLKTKMDMAIELLEMVIDNTKMPHQHDDPLTRLYCLAERARETLEYIKEAP